MRVLSAETQANPADWAEAGHDPPHRREKHSSQVWALGLNSLIGRLAKIGLSAQESHEEASAEENSLRAMRHGALCGLHQPSALHGGLPRNADPLSKRGRSSQ